MRAPFPAHLPHERVVIQAPTACPCCGGRLPKLGETVTETLGVVPRQWKVIQTVREKFTCRSSEKITQPPAPFHVISRGHVGPSLLAMILYAKYGEHHPLNRAERELCPRGRRPRRLDLGRSCRRRRSGTQPADRADPQPCVRCRPRAQCGELYDAKRKPGPITEAACWSHGRRHFFEQADLRKAPLAVEAVQRIDEIFAIDRTINGQSAGDRLAVAAER